MKPELSRRDTLRCPDKLRLDRKRRVRVDVLTDLNCGVCPITDWPEFLQHRLVEFFHLPPRARRVTKLNLDDDKDSSDEIEEHSVGLTPAFAWAPRLSKHQPRAWHVEL